MTIDKLIRGIYKKAPYWIGLCKNITKSNIYAEDLFQEVVVVMDQKLRSGAIDINRISTEDGINKSYLTRVLINKCLGHIQKQKPQVEFQEWHAKESDDPLPDYRTLAEEIEQDLKDRAAKSKADNCQVQIFNVNMGQRVSLRQMEKDTGITYGTLFRIKKELQDKLNRKFLPRYIETVAGNRSKKISDEKN